LIKLSIGGKLLRLGEIGDVLMQAVVDQVAAKMRERLSAVRHPETGEFPTVVASGSSLQTLSFRVERSPELLARDRFGSEELESMTLVSPPAGPPLWPPASQDS